MDKSSYWLGVVVALSLSSAHAMNREIRASFHPDPTQPNNNTFINKTPNSGYCAIYPGQCNDNHTFSIQLPVRFISSRAISPGEAVALKVPANWRQLTVINKDTQQAETVELRIFGVGSQYELSDSAANLVGVTDILEGHQTLWRGNSWVYAPAPCQYSGVGSYAPASYRFFWKAPLEMPCIKVAAFNIPSMAFGTLDFAYELRTPNPLGMSNGQYTGSFSYTLGPGGDFDLGSMMNPNDHNLTLDFVLEVDHTLKVDLPPGGSSVVLEPEGGWQQWIDGGRKPTRITRDQTFYLSASSRFKVMMQCQYPTHSDQCGLSGGGLVADVRTYLTLPDGVSHAAGGPVHHHPLRDNIWSTPFQPNQYVDRTAGTLHFEMPQESIESMLRPGVGARLVGNITVIWDSEV